MSADMYWRPAPPKMTGEYVPDQLRQILTKKLAHWGREELLNGDVRELSAPDLSYLEGLRDAGVEGAQELINGIMKHLSIEIWCER